MPDVTIARGHDTTHGRPTPATPDEARRRLEQGNRAFADALAAGPGARLGSLVAGAEPGPEGAPAQRPFAAVLGCSDARVPVELVFNQAFNDLFVVRVAGNVLGSECLGSINYAMAHLGGSLELLVVLGHGQCGAVTAAVDAFITPGSYLELLTNHSLRSVVDRISVGVRAAARGLETVYGPDAAARPGYRTALVEVSVAVHAALTAQTLVLEFAGRPGCGVCFGMFDMTTGRVGLPAASDEPSEVSLVVPPPDLAGFAALLRRLASARSVRQALGEPN